MIRRTKENGYNESEREGPAAKRHAILSPTINSRLSPAVLTPLILHGNSHHPVHHPMNTSILNSHLTSRSMLEDSNAYHNNREINSNGRNHLSTDHINDRYSLASERYERDFRPSVGLYSNLQRDLTEDRDMEDEWKNIHTVSYTKTCQLEHKLIRTSIKLGHFIISLIP